MTDAFVVALLFGLTNIASYAFVVLAGRVLTPFEFGTVNSLLGLLTMGNVVAVALQMAIARAIAVGVTDVGLSSIARKTAIASFTAVLVTIVALVPLAKGLKLSSWQVAWVSLAIGLAFSSSAAQGLLIGLERTRIQGVLNLGAALARLTCGWLLFKFGCGTSGAVASYAAGYIVISLFALPFVRGQTVEGGHRASSEVRVELGPMVTFILAYMPTTLDQLLVQWISPDLGGTYAAIATVGKLGMFVAYPITLVAYSRLLREPKLLDWMRIVCAAAAGIVIVAGGIATLLHFQSAKVLAMFFGNRFADAADNLGTMGISIVAAALAMFGTHALVALRARGAFVPSAIAVAVGLMLLLSHSESLNTLTQYLLIVHVAHVLLTFIYLACYLTFPRKTNREQYYRSTVASEHPERANEKR